MSCTSIKPAFKIITEVGLKRYSEIKDINSIKIGCVTSGRGGGVWCQTGYITFKFHCFTVHFNSMNFTYQLMHFYI